MGKKKRKTNNVRPVERVSIDKTFQQQQEEIEKYYEEYYKELNEFAQASTWNEMYNVKDKLLNKATDFFVAMANKEPNTDEEKLRFSIKSVLNQLQIDTEKAANGNSYSPIFANTLTQHMYPRSTPTTIQRVKELLKSPEAYADQIRNVSEYVRNNVLQYDRIEEYFISMFSFKYDLLPKRDPNEISNFESSKKKVYNFLQSLRIKEQYPRIVADVIKNGIGFYMFKKGSDFTDLIRLPIEYCRVTNVRNSFGICFEVELQYFRGLVDTGALTPEIYEYYKDLIEKCQAPMEDTSSKVTQHRIYVPISPIHGFCFSADSYRPTAVPLLAALLPDALDILEYKNLAKQKAILETWCIIPQIIPYDQAEKPKVPLQLAKQTINNLQNVLPPGVVTFSTPLDVKDSITLNNTSNQDNIVGIGEQKFFSTVGVAGNVMGIGEAKNNAVVDFSNAIDFGYVSHIYNQFTLCTNLLIMMFVNERDWKVKFFGNYYRDSKEVSEAQAVFSGTNLPAEYLGARLGYEPFEFEYMLKMGEKNKLKEKMVPLANTWNTNGADIISGKTTTTSSDNNGRPRESVRTEITTSGETSRETSENNGTAEE